MITDEEFTFEVILLVRSYRNGESRFRSYILPRSRSTRFSLTLYNFDPINAFCGINTMQNLLFIPASIVRLMLGKSFDDWWSTATHDRLHLDTAITIISRTESALNLYHFGSETWLVIETRSLDCLLSVVSTYIDKIDGHFQLLLFHFSGTQYFCCIEYTI